MGEARQRLEAILALAGMATKGPWEVWTGCSWRRIGSVATQSEVICPTNNPHDRHPDLAGTMEDLEFAAAARTDVPALARALLVALDALEKADEGLAAIFGQTTDREARELATIYGRLSHAALAEIERALSATTEGE